MLGQRHTAFLEPLEDIVDLASRQDEGEDLVVQRVLDLLVGALRADWAALIEREENRTRVSARRSSPRGGSRRLVAPERLIDESLLQKVLRGDLAPISLERPTKGRWILGLPVIRRPRAKAVLIAEGSATLPPDLEDLSSPACRAVRCLSALGLLLAREGRHGKNGKDHNCKEQKEPESVEAGAEPRTESGRKDGPASSTEDSPEGAARVRECPAALAEPGGVRQLGRLFPEILGRSAAMRGVLCAVADLAPSEIPVHIEGESGTGKELVATAIHRLSRRSEGPFVSENCGAIPDALVESELFGHEKGAFTGAMAPRTGLVERAHGGTLFLDEIGEMSISQQKKLLRVLQERRVRRVGGPTDIDVDFRIISATNQNLEDLVTRGVFREDLFYRLHAAVLTLPALRDRGEDIPLLADHFNQAFARQLGRDPVELSDEALQILAAYSWPGNVRELRNEMWRLVSFARGKVKPNHLSRRILRSFGSSRDTVSPPSCGGKSLPDIERELVGPVIEKALARTRGNLSQAARALGISRASLYRRMRRYGLSKRR